MTAYSSLVTGLVLAILFAIPGRATSAEVPPIVIPLRDKFDLDVAEIRDALYRSQNGPRAQYLLQINEALEKAHAEGDLDLVLLIREERTSVTRGGDLTEVDLPTMLKRARKQFLNQSTEAEEEFRQKVRTLFNTFLVDLELVEKQQTRAGQFTLALSIREYREDMKTSGLPVLDEQPPQPSDARLGEWVDLLAWTEGVDWSPRGTNWNANLVRPMTRTQLVLPETWPSFSAFPLAAWIDGDYELDVEFTKLAGAHSICIHFPVDQHTSYLHMTGESYYGFGCVDGIRAYTNETTTRPGLVIDGQRHRVLIHVRCRNSEAEVRVDLDQRKDALKWSGPTERLRNRLNCFVPGITSTMINHCWIGSECSVEIHSARIRMLNGTIRRDVIGPTERQQNLNDGFHRLIGENPVETQGAEIHRLRINHCAFAVSEGEWYWPRVSASPRFCTDYLGAHAPSRLSIPIPTGSKSFSVIGYNGLARQAICRVLIDGKLVYDSGVAIVAVAKVGIPLRSKLLDLVIDDAGSSNNDHTYWCYPRFHNVSVENLSEKMLHRPMKNPQISFLENSVGFGKLTISAPIIGTTGIPLHFQDAIPCDEFLCMYAPSSVTYEIPDGMTRFTCVGHSTLSKSLQFEVWADDVRVFASATAGIVPIDVWIPRNARKIKLALDPLGNSFEDWAMFCYPRLHKN